MLTVTSGWGWPQWAMIILTTLSLFSSVKYHNKAATSSAKRAFVLLPITVLILCGGGFFARIDWPQVVWITLITLATGASLIVDGGIGHKRNFWHALVAQMILLVLYSSAGFFR